MSERFAITKQYAKDYFSLSKKEKGMVLNNLCKLTGFSKPYAVTKLKTVFFKTADRPKKRKGRKPKYSNEFIKVLTDIWIKSGQMCGGSIYIYK